MSFAGGQLLTCFYTFMTSLFAALLMVPFLRLWALEQGRVDAPDARKVHTVAMPRLGGIAIFLAFLFAVIIFLPIDTTIRGILAGTLVIFATGVVDDLHGLGARGKFTGQVAACLITLLVGRLYLTELGDLFGFGAIVLPLWAAIPFTVFAVVGVINAINLIDGLDGLAGGVACIALAAFFLLGWLTNDPVTMVLAAAMIGAVLGFLKDNFYPANIFMGDTGAMVVGYLLACLALYTTQQPGATISPMVPVLILGLPLLDTVWVLLRRLLQGGSPFTADRSHLHHKFLDLGFAHHQTVIMIYGMSLFWAICALLLRGLPEYVLLLCYLLTAGGGYLLLRVLLAARRRQRAGARDSVALRDMPLYRTLCEHAQRLLLPVRLLLGLYLLLAVAALCRAPVLPWQIAATLLAGGGLLWLRWQKDDRQFILLIAYAAFAMLATQLWTAELAFAGGLTFKRAGDILLGTAGSLAALRLLFRQAGDFALTSADSLVLAICIFLAIASQQELLGYSINGPLFRTVVGVVVIRTLLGGRQTTRPQVVWAAFALLAIIALVGLLAG
ncbi:MAG: MraY family glycosyltransferase [Desulfuromonadales bacterium]|nr:MraY family glycosyltransferase [Desulfuromonadales bacterium]